MSGLWRRVQYWILGVEVKPAAEREPVPAVVEPIVVPDHLSWPSPDPAWEAREDLLLGRVARHVERGASPWDAAGRVFCGTGETSGASRAGLSATLAARRRGVVHD
ncbi:hypothetical protein Sme01_03680 [Sphaerisporangium melleum]|uniref:Uncharacterized protein n=1 Tax=Sphaerisporangium melleum TaxID=321316 RepID=A0A917QP49_9ACTN|nr:hypothetical protein [Sphaerisporangium melleum]GGK61824.1 hypothetical protein GCM10007964_01230 [Sphaerisporangium melleum]GII67892.1 hypothetical protein Sme01_03680 [Sphaerisporangium melleum]